MTKLTHIQELADKHCSETRVFKGEYSHEFTAPQLEALRAAIIRDFVTVVKSECDKLSQSSRYRNGVDDTLSIMAITASVEWKR